MRVMLSSGDFQEDPINPRVFEDAVAEASGARPEYVHGAIWQLVGSGEILYELDGLHHPPAAA